MIRYGIAGFGLHAVRRMMPGFALAKKSQAVALTRRDKQKARENAKKFNIPLVFASAEEMCSHPDVDVVFVTTPNVCHLKDVLTAVRHGKHVLCEKPLAMNAAECREMVRAGREAGVRLGTAHVFRFAHSVEYMRERLPELGPILTARAEFSYPGHTSERLWINDRAIGGGTLADVGVHCFDTLRYILRDEVVRIQAITRATENGEVDASAAMILEFSRGTLATVNVSARAGYRTAVELVGAGGSLNADYALSVDSPLQVEFSRGSQVVERREFTNCDAYARMLDGFSEWVEDGKEFAAPGEEGWRNQAIIDAGYLSAREGRVVAVPEAGSL